MAVVDYYHWEFKSQDWIFFPSKLKPLYMYYCIFTQYYLLDTDTSIQLLLKPLYFFLGILYTSKMSHFF